MVTFRYSVTSTDACTATPLISLWMPMITRKADHLLLSGSLASTPGKLGFWALSRLQDTLTVMPVFPAGTLMPLALPMLRPSRNIRGFFA